MYKILTEEGKLPYIEHDVYGRIELPDDMLNFIVSYLTNKLSCEDALREFVENYNRTVIEL